MAKANVDVGVLDRNDDRTPRGQRGRHLRTDLAPKPRNHPACAGGETPPYGMIGGIEETSASFEARSAPRSYPTSISGPLRFPSTECRGEALRSPSRRNGTPPKWFGSRARHRRLGVHSRSLVVLNFI